LSKRGRRAPVTTATLLLLLFFKRRVTVVVVVAGDMRTTTTTTGGGGGGEGGEEEEEKADDDGLMGDFFEEVAKAERDAAFAAGAKDGGKEEEEGEEERLKVEREQSFVDDDGTTYDWSEEEGRYKPRGENLVASASGGGEGGSSRKNNDASGGVVGFDVSQMTFCPDEGEEEFGAPPRSTTDAYHGGGNNKSNENNKRKKPDVDIEAVRRKREQQQQNKSKKKKQKKPNAAQTRTQTTSVYCENLPRDATVERVEKFFSKCGQIKQDPATLLPKIKLYKEEGSNAFSGNALVTYLLRPSVELALTVLDGAKFELVGDEVKVTEADFSKSKGGEKDTPADNEKTNDVKAPSSTDKYSHVPKEEIRKNAALLKRKAERQLGWDGFDDEHDPTRTMVVLRNIYDENDLEEARRDGLNAQSFSDELKEDVANECKKIGKVENAYVNANGVVTVRFKDPEGAEACLEVMHNRWFGGKQLKAEMWNGVEKFIGLKSIEKKETEEEEKRRLDAYAATLGHDSDSD